MWAEPEAGMGWRHSVPLALSALSIDRGGAQGAVGVNNRPKPKPAAPKGGTGPPGLSEASGLVLRRVRRGLRFARGWPRSREGGGEAKRAHRFSEQRKQRPRRQLDARNGLDHAAILPEPKEDLQLKHFHRDPHQDRPEARGAHGRLVTSH